MPFLFKNHLFLIINFCWLMSFNILSIISNTCFFMFFFPIKLKTHHPRQILLLRLLERENSLTLHLREDQIPFIKFIVDIAFRTIIKGILFNTNHFLDLKFFFWGYYCWKITKRIKTFLKHTHKKSYKYLKTIR